MLELYNHHKKFVKKIKKIFMYSTYWQTPKNSNFFGIFTNLLPEKGRN